MNSYWVVRLDFKGRMGQSHSYQPCVWLPEFLQCTDRILFALIPCPGESIDAGIKGQYVLGKDEALVVEAIEQFTDDSVTGKLHLHLFYVLHNNSMFPHLSSFYKAKV